MCVVCVVCVCVVCVVCVWCVCVYVCLCACVSCEVHPLLLAPVTCTNQHGECNELLFHYNNNYLLTINRFQPEKMHPYVTRIST